MAVNSTPAYAVILHSGVISIDTIWDNTDTHLVTGDITVNNYSTLTIQAGTIVKFAALSDDTTGGSNTSSSELIVESGSLVIAGTAASPVTLTSDAALIPAKGDWQGIQVTSGGELTVQHAVIEYTSTGISYNKSGVVAGNPVLEDSIIRFTGGHGLYFDARGGAKLTLGVRRNEIHTTSNQGLYLHSQDAGTFVQGEFVANTIHDNNYSAIYLYASNQAYHDLTITDNTLYNAGLNAPNAYNYANNTGITIFTTSSYDTRNNYIVRNNTISNNKSHGIYLYATNEPDINLLLEGNTLRNNTRKGLYVSARGRSGWVGYGPLYLNARNNAIHDNGEDGVYLFDESKDVSSSSYYGNKRVALYARFNLNKIYNNAGYGLYTQNHWPVYVVHNRIENNTSGGLYLNTNSTSYINFNNITANGGYGLRNNTSAAIDARYNWWDTAATDQMVAGTNPKNINTLYDVYDNGAIGTIDYSSWLSSKQTEPLSLEPQSWIKSPTNNKTLKANVYKITGSASYEGEIKRVEVSVDNGINWITASGSYHWSYSWTVPVTTEATAYQIRSRVVTVDDVIETPKVGHTLTVNPNLATTSGTITADETWSGVVNVTGDVTVASGVTLTVLPGTQVIFEPHSDDTRSGNDHSRSELIVLGSMIVSGIESQRVLFTSNSTTKGRTDWYGVRVRGTLILDYADVEYASGAVRCESYSTPADCVIRNANISQSGGHGISLSSDGVTTHKLNVSTSNISENSSHGIYIYAYRENTLNDFNITGNNISNNSGNGINIYCDNRSKCNGIISNNIIDRNSTYGIYTRSTSYAVNNISTISNTITNIVGGIGLYHDISYGNGSIYQINENNISQNANGIKIKNSYTGSVSVSIKNNSIFENVTSGIETEYVTGSGTSTASLVPSFDGNIIYRNTNGIKLNVTGVVSLPRHQLYDNFYDIYNNTGHAVSATSVWWGVNTTNEFNIGTHPRNLSNIYDSYENSALGTVDYSSWLAVYAQPAVPVLTAVQSPTNAPAQILSGTKEADTGIVINGSTVVPIDVTTTWTYTMPLAESKNNLSIYAINSVGLLSDAVNTSLTLDTKSPQVFTTTPSDGAILSLQPNNVEIVLYDQTTVVDGTASITNATVLNETSSPVAGSWQANLNRLIFTPTNPFDAGVYTVTIQPTDSPLGNTSVASFTFTVDTAAPVAVTLNAVASPTTATPITLSGSKEANTAIYINNKVAIALDAATTWSYQQVLRQGDNVLSIEARDAAGNRSPPVEKTITLDSIAPAIVSMLPANGSNFSQQPLGINITVNETGTGINKAATLATANVIRSGGTPVSGSWDITPDNHIVFTPSSVMFDSTYSVIMSIQDVAGNATALNASFTYDSTPPALPKFNAVTTPTNTNSQVVSGTKEAGTSIWVNNTLAVPFNANTTWSYTVVLTPGDNVITAFSRDVAGNQSGNVSTTIRYDDIAPLPVTELTVQAEGTGTTASLNWSGYDETVHGDISGYRIYSATSLFTNVGTMTPVTSLPSGTKTYEFSNLGKNQKYFFVVVAVDSNNNINNSVTPVSATTKDILPPEEVTNIKLIVMGDAVNIGWTASVNSANDLASYKFYFNGDAGTLLPSTTTDKSALGLLPATSYAYKVSAIDSDGNESTGVSGNVVTIVENPTGLAVTPYSGKVELTWNAVAKPSLIKEYAIYAETTDFTNIGSLKPKLILAKNFTTKQLAGLTNNIKYFFAVTAINTSGGESSNVTTVSATPVPDTEGPVLNNIKFNTTALTEGMTITQSGNISATATDQSGVGRIEFLINDAVLATDTNGSNGYTATWDITTIANGIYKVSVKAYDTLNNFTQTDVNVNVVLAPPAVPSITSPQSGKLVNEKTIVISGTAEKQTQVQLYNNTVVTGTLIDVDTNGNFSASISLTEGDNSITASAKNRGGEGQQSPPVVVTVDSSIPSAPSSVSATAKSSGQINVSWSLVADTTVVGYDIYRSTQDFTDTVSAIKVNSSLATKGLFVDLPPADGEYFYRVVAINRVKTSSNVSVVASAIADNTAPKAVSIEYTPSGNFDPVTKRMAPGKVDLKLIVSESLLTAPFLSVAPNNGVPLSVTLNRVSNTEYTGSFTIATTTPTGTAYVVFSARDTVGNRGTQIDVGETIEFDTQGPVINKLSIVPTEPVKTDSNNPTEVKFSLALNEAIAGQPTLSYLLSAVGRTEVVIDSLVQTDTLRWDGSFILPADAAVPDVENLSFIYSAVDDLGNTSTRILGDNAFQVYQGNLPPLATPIGLTAVAKPSGQIQLDWTAVEGVTEYVVYRQAPGETALTEYKRVTAITDIDQTTNDGDYSYSVASVRKENGQEGISAQSATVTASADSVIPATPINLALQLAGNGINATWDAPVGNTEKLTYSLYRANADITDTSTLTPIATDISELVRLDPSPSNTEHSYAVVAVDIAGNQSAPSATVYLNFDLLPVATLNVIQTDLTAPIISWTHNGSTIAGYDFYLDSALPIKLNGTSLITGTSYTDAGFNNNTRAYKVIAVDANSKESVARAITLPKVRASLKANTDNSPVVKRGIMNQVNFDVTNSSTATVSNIQLKVALASKNHISQKFSLAAGETKVIPVTVGGYSNLTDVSSMTTTIEVKPGAGETVQIIRTQDIEVGSSALSLALTTQEFTRGATGKVQFTLQNTSAVETELALAKNGGNTASNEVRFKLLDVDGNVLATQGMQQFVSSIPGNQVVTVIDGTTVARIPAGSTFTSDLFDINIPSSAPSEVTVRLEVDKLHYHYGRSDAVTIDGLDTRQTTPLVDTAYSCKVDGITPQSSFGDQDIVIAGQAIDRTTSLPVINVPLKLVVVVGGFERVFNVFTDASGGFSYTYTPQAGEAGIYNVSCIHPELVERPVSTTFTINRVLFSPTTLNINIPFDYEQSLNVGVRAGDGTTATNLRLVYDAADQTGGSLVQGVTVTAAPATTLLSKQSKNLILKIKADSSAPATGNLYLKAYSDESGTKALQTIRINYNFSQATPVLSFSPNNIQTGVAQGGSVSENFTLENRGLGEMTNVNVALLNTNGSAAPSWMSLTSLSKVGLMNVGDKRDIGFTASPDANLVDGIYKFILRVTADNHQTVDINITVSVTQSGVGSLEFKVADIYTATKDVNGDIIQGLAGASIRIQNEQVLSVTQTITTDNTGGAFIQELPAGSYTYRASATNHNDVNGRFLIKPGTPTTESIFLNYDLVTVEWSVNETTITDEYKITLKATFETDVPVAVVIMDPPSVSLPQLAAGDVFFGEVTLTNHGLIRADDVVLDFARSDSYVKYDVQADLIPTSLEAGQVVTIPYRITALKDFTNAGTGTATGGGCFSYTNCKNCTYKSQCANGDIVDGSSSTCFTHYSGTCDGGVPTFNSGGTGGSTVTSGGSGTSYSPSYENNITGLAACRPIPGTKRCENE